MSYDNSFSQEISGTFWFWLDWKYHKTTFLMVFWHLDYQDQMVHRSAEEALNMNNDTLLKIIQSYLISLNIREKSCQFVLCFEHTIYI